MEITGSFYDSDLVKESSRFFFEPRQKADRVYRDADVLRCTYMLAVVCLLRVLSLSGTNALLGRDANS